jgi:hypothetical protein
MIMMRAPELGPNFPKLAPTPDLLSGNHGNTSEDKVIGDKKWKLEGEFAARIARLREYNRGLK